jgi:predicted Mrr-cat superfamily restriction endonuclease
MPEKAWGIKLGSGGVCVPFCERHRIVGLGWKSVDSRILRIRTREEIWKHLRATYPPDAASDRNIGSSTGQLYRFVQECAEGDYVLYYDPPRKRVQVCRITSDAKYREFEPDEDIDIWHYRDVEYPTDPIPILDFYGALKGKLLGPRSSFWSVGPYEIVHQIARGLAPNIVAAPDQEISAAYAHLRGLIVRRAEALGPQDWEWLVADYLKSLGAEIDDQIGGSRPIIDVEARFDHKELPETVWRVQVKRYQGRQIDWPEIQRDIDHAGECDRFLYVSVFGFTEEARRKANDEGVVLLESQDFAMFLMGGRFRDSLRQKLRLPSA